MSNPTNSYYVITGGPGVGKTTLVTALELRGFKIIAEDARRIIKEQLAMNGKGLPWENKLLYARLMIEAARYSYRKLEMEPKPADPVFFDRGLLDAVCYMKMEGIAITGHVRKWITACTYASPVFILPPWREIYETDNARKQSWTEACTTYDFMKQTYAGYGYEVIDVPPDTAINRADFILRSIGKP